MAQVFTSFEEFSKDHLEKNRGQRFSIYDLEQLYAQHRQSIGGNQPPSPIDEEIEKLQTRSKDLQDHAEQIIIPDLPEQVEPIADQLLEFLKMCSVVCTLSEESRKKLKAPFLEQGRSIDAKLLAISAPLHKLIDNIKPALARYLDWKGVDRLRSEHGALASLTTRTEIREWKRNTIDLEALREFLDAEAIEKAIRAYHKKNGRKLKGVKWLEKSIITVR